MRVISLSLALASVLLAADACAQINKCVQADGSVRFSDRPCPTGAKVEAVRIVKDTSSTPYVPDLDKPAAQQLTVPAQVAAAPELDPRKISYMCTAENGFVWYLHSTPCPRTARLPTGRRRGSVYETDRMDVREAIVKRREACKAIEAVDADDRPGSRRDERDTTQDKAMNRDHC